MSGKHVIEVKELRKSFGQNQVVDRISFKVESGDVFGFLGPNGAGKTTSMRMMLGLVSPDEGTVAINGYDIGKNFLKAISRVGAIVETPKFYPYLSGRQNLQQIANLHSQVNSMKIDEVLDMVGLSARSDEKVGIYSLGMKQRLGIARALLNDPNVIFLDEPTNGLDPQGMKEIREMICQLAMEKDITFFISTHLLHEVEQTCNKVAILNKGKLITQGTVNELLGKENEHVEIRTPDAYKASNVLKDIGYVKSVKPGDDGLEVELEKGRSWELNRLLVSHNIIVHYLLPKNQSLEQFFIELTEGGKRIA